MNKLIKIADMSGKYEISARTLRYYEDMGLITSTRSDEYAYRMYDEAAVKRLEQILILRKLNIGIRDIKRVFDTTGSSVVLEVLDKKINDIDDEVALLHELKDIILDFIRQIKGADFGKESDVKQLYEKARDIETQLVNVDYNGNPSNTNRFMEITEQLEKKENIVRKSPTFSVTFGIAGGAEVRREAFALYEKAFNATKTWEEAPYDSPEEELHIGMDINGTWFLLHPSGPVGDKRFNGVVSCNMHFDNEDDLHRAYDALAEEGQGEWLGSAPHAPLSAFVTDKFGIGWWLHT